MRNLMKFGMVLVVLAMVAGSAFARTTTYIGPVPGPPEDPSWCTEANWDEGVPRDGKKDEATIDNGNTVVIDCEPAMIGTLKIRRGGVQVGTEMIFLPEPPWFIPAFRVEEFYIDDDLEMSDKNTSDFSVLNIVNGDVIIEDQSKDVFEDGSGEITIAAGSSLIFEDGVYFGDSNGDGCGDTYTLGIAGNFTVEGDRLEHRGGHLIFDLTGNGSVDCTDKTTRLSSKRDAITTINIGGNAVYSTDKIELGEGNDGADCDYSLAINVYDNGTFDGEGEEIKDQDDGQILVIDVTDTGTFLIKDLNINDDDGEINITMDSGLIDVSDDIDMNAGDIVITGGVFNVQDNFELGDDGVATLTISGTADVFIDDLYMGKNSELTVNGVRLDLDDLKDLDDFDGSIEINGDGSIVMNDADLDDMDDIDALIESGAIMTSDAGKVIVADYGVTHEGKLTLQAVYPFEVDILPGGCPNPLRINFDGGGVYPVAIVASAAFDVTTIDVSKPITLIGVEALRSAVGDVSTAGECSVGTDGIPDLILKFRRSDVMDALNVLYGVDAEEVDGELVPTEGGSIRTLSLIENRTELKLILLAKTIDGDTVGGTDNLTILNRSLRKIRRR